MEYVKSPVGTYCYHFQPTATGYAYLEAYRLASSAVAVIAELGQVALDKVQLP